MLSQKNTNIVINSHDNNTCCNWVIHVDTDFVNTFRSR